MPAWRLARLRVDFRCLANTSPYSCLTGPPKIAHQVGVGVISLLTRSQPQPHGRAQDLTAPFCRPFGRLAVQYPFTTLSPQACIRTTRLTWLPCQVHRPPHPPSPQSQHTPNDRPPLPFVHCLHTVRQPPTLLRACAVRHLLPPLPEHGEHVVAHKLLPQVVDEDLFHAHLLSLSAGGLQLLALRPTGSAQFKR